MIEVENLTAAPLMSSCNSVPETPNIVPGWQKCMSCSDYGISCNGPSLGTLGNIDSVRSFHKAMRKARKLSLKTVCDAAPSISDSTINEYFSNVVKDFKWTTVSAIDNAISCICGNRVGALPLDNSCPASSSEFRNQIAAADLKVAAAELKAAQSETDIAGLMQKLASAKERHIAQIAQLESNHAKDLDWMKNEVRLWRRFAFLLLGVGLLLLILLVFCVGWSVANHTLGINLF